MAIRFQRCPSPGDLEWREVSMVEDGSAIVLITIETELN
jgi:hypothetical protein